MPIFRPQAIDYLNKDGYSETNYQASSYRGLDLIIKLVSSDAHLQASSC